MRVAGFNGMKTFYSDCSKVVLSRIEIYIFYCRKSTKIYLSISLLPLSVKETINLHSLPKYVPKKDYIFYSDVQLCILCKSWCIKKFTHLIWFCILSIFQFLDLFWIMLIIFWKKELDLFLFDNALILYSYQVCTFFGIVIPNWFLSFLGKKNSFQFFISLL